MMCVDLDYTRILITKCRLHAMFLLFWEGVFFGGLGYNFLVALSTTKSEIMEVVIVDLKGNARLRLMTVMKHSRSHHENKIKVK